MASNLRLIGLQGAYPVGTGRHRWNMVVEAHPTDEHSSVPVDYIDNDVAGSLMGTAYTDGRRNDDQTQVPLVTIAHPHVDSFLSIQSAGLQQLTGYPQPVAPPAGTRAARPRSSKALVRSPAVAVATPTSQQALLSSMMSHLSSLMAQSAVQSLQPPVPSSPSCVGLFLLSVPAGASPSSVWRGE